MATPDTTSLNDGTTVSIRLLLGLGGVVLTFGGAAVAFAASLNGRLDALTLEVRLMRQEVGHHIAQGTHNDAVHKSALRAYLNGLRAANPNMVIPEYTD